VFHIFAHLKKYHNTEVVYDPSDPVIDEARFDAKGWASSEFGHLDGVEELPPNMPESRGQGFVKRAKVDAVTRRSRTGFFVWINSCLVLLLEQEANVCGDFFLWIRVCCNEAMLRISQRAETQAQDDGDPSEWPLLYLWRQPVGAGKHDRARLDTEEDVTEHCIPFCP
jgi:hypothetical protein